MRSIGQLRLAGSETVLVEHLWMADSFFGRLRGLQFRAPLPDGHGLLLVPCRSIHTCWMRFAIDLICLDINARVLDVRRQVVPWRVAIVNAETYGIVEVTAGNADQIQLGHKLQLASACSSLERPVSLRFLA
jgi:uncharacterized membrane protein (UPF0127 family)